MRPREFRPDEYAHLLEGVALGILDAHSALEHYLHCENYLPHRRRFLNYIEGAYPANCEGWGALYEGLKIVGELIGDEDC